MIPEHKPVPRLFELSPTLQALAEEVRSFFLGVCSTAALIFKKLDNPKGDIGAYCKTSVLDPRLRKKSSKWALTGCGLRTGFMCPPGIQAVRTLTRV